VGQLRVASVVVDTECAIDFIGSGDNYTADVDIGGQVQLQGSAEVLEGKGVVAALGIHGELMDGVLNIGLSGWEGDVHTVGSQRGGVEGAESGVAYLTTDVVENGGGGRFLRRGRVDAATISAIDGNAVATDPVEGSAAEGGLAVLAGAVLHRGTELGAVGSLLLVAGSEGE